MIAAPPSAIEFHGVDPYDRIGFSVPAWVMRDFAPVEMTPGSPFALFHLKASGYRRGHRRRSRTRRTSWSL